MTVEEAVRQAHDAFYRALNRTVQGDGSLMPTAWWHGDQVTTAHPMGGFALGWAEVSASWDELSKTLSDGHVEMTDLVVIVVNEDVAYTVGIEHVEFTVLGRHVKFAGNTTNVYARRDGQWKIVHHHPDRAPAAESAALEG